MSRAPTARVPQAGDPPRSVECRVYERQASALQAACRPLAARSSGETRWRASIRDISAGRVGLVLVRRFEAGTALAIELPASAERPSDTLLVKVVHVAPGPDGHWLLGCTFVSRLSEDDDRSVAALARQLHRPPAVQVPKAPNGLPGQATAPENDLPPAVAIPDLWFEGTAHGGKVVRVRVRRLRLAGNWPLAAGTVLRLWVGDKRRHPGGVLVEVVGCRKQARGWLVSYRPVEVVTAEMLRTLGFAG
jgi:hypothetical protein